MSQDKPTCQGCGTELERLGGSRSNLGGTPVEVTHYVCGGCRKRWLHHSVKGWRETDRDLSS